MNIINSIRKVFIYTREYGISRLVKKVIEQENTPSFNYLKWYNEHKSSEEELNKQKEYKFQYEPLISIIVPTYKTPNKFLTELISSVLNQTYKNFELCIADGSEEDTSVYGVIKDIADKRIKYLKLEKNYGISENTNRAINMAKGEFIALLDHDDILEPDALFYIVNEINKNNEPDIIYTDEDKIDSDNGNLFQPHFKRDFNMDLLRSNNYICHFFVVRKNIAEIVGGFRKEFDGSQDYDFIFRCVEEAKNIVHVKRVLYHWRIHMNSVALNPESKMYAYEAGKRAIEAHLKRNDIEAQVINGDNLGFYKVIYSINEKPMVTVIVTGEMNKNNCTKYMKYLQNTLSYENIKIVTEKEFIKGTGTENPYYLFIEINSEVSSGNFVQELLSNSMREDIALVGPRVNKAGKIFCAGGVYNDEILEYQFRGLPKWYQGYFLRAVLQQNVDTLCGICIMVKAAVFTQYKNDNLSISKENAEEFCREIIQDKKLIVYDPLVSIDIKYSPKRTS